MRVYCVLRTELTAKDQKLKGFIYVLSVLSSYENVVHDQCIEHKYCKSDILARNFMSLTLSDLFAPDDSKVTFQETRAPTNQNTRDYQTDRKPVIIFDNSDRAKMWNKPQ